MTILGPDEGMGWTEEPQIYWVNIAVFRRVFRPSWATIYTGQAKIWHGSVRHVQQFNGAMYMTMLPVY